ncbi:MAG: endonuclease III domain-containing protein [Actinomycetota bacterium]
MPARSERARASQIVRRLLRAYPSSHPARPSGKQRDPLSELIFTTLSQNTSDVNRDRAWASMKREFPTWREVLAAPTAALERAIAVGGLAKTKAPRIQAILREVIDREGRPSLARLRRMPDDEVAAYLETLPGIGPKTIACVLAFSLERPRLPVDTHVHRVGSRLGFFDVRAKDRAAQAAIEAAVPEKNRVETHLALIAHGRTTCTAQRPACDRCVLADLCPSAFRVPLQ